MPIKILLLSPMRPGTGNLSTANRIAQTSFHLQRGHFDQDSGYICVVEDNTSFTDAAQLQQYVTKKKIQAVIGIHALRAGKLLLGCQVPYAVIFGGTDVNEFSKLPEVSDVMSRVLQGASCVVSFMESILEKAKSIWPHLSEKETVVIPQAVITSPVSCPRVSFKQRLQLDDDAILFTLVGAIRPVKDQLFLLQAFTEWHQLLNPKAYLLIVGPPLDEEYAEKVMFEINGSPGLKRLEYLPLAETHALIAESFALVNSSLSESMPSSILEAMDMNTAVIARRIDGNLTLVTDRQTGLLYDTPQEFICKAELLLADPDLRSEMIRNAKARIEKISALDKEKAAYLALVKRLLY